MRRRPSQGASISAGGTRVVLPEPGGACSTTGQFRASASAISGITARTGRSGSQAYAGAVTGGWNGAARRSLSPGQIVVLLRRRRIEFEGGQHEAMVGGNEA